MPVVIDDEAGTCAVDGEPTGWCVAVINFEDGCGPSDYTCNDGAVESGGAFRTPLSRDEPWLALTEFYPTYVQGPFCTKRDGDQAGTACECQCDR